MPYITGAGWITAADMGRGRQHHHFEMPPGRLPTITGKASLNTPFAHFGRMDAFSKLGMAGIASALKDARLDTRHTKRPVAMVASTVCGCIQTDMDYFDTAVAGRGDMASPGLFSYTLSNCFLGEAACYFGITGVSYVIYDTRFAGLSSVRALLLHMELDECDAGLAGIVNGDTPPELSLPEAPRPGAAFVVIEKTPGTDGHPYGRIELSPQEDVLFGGKNITTFIHLIQACLTLFHGKEIRDETSEIRDQTSEIRHQTSEIRDQTSEI